MAIKNNNAQEKAPRRAQKVHEPAFHIVKRSEIVWWKPWIFRVIAFLAALVFCAIITYFLTLAQGNPINPLEVYKAMLSGNFGSVARFWPLLKETALLLGVALAITPAFKMRFWNIGAEGQVLVGALASFAFMYIFGKMLPNTVLLICMFIVAAVAGGIWGLVPAVFKARWNTNETLFTLMMNYIAIHLVKHFVNIWSGSSSTINMGFEWIISKKGTMPYVFGQQYFLHVAIVFCLAILVYVYLKYSKQGYEISVVGESENTARYIGINVKKVVIRTMIISGIICGIVGFLLITIDTTVNFETAGGRGFTAIMVSWLAKFNPLAMIFTSFLIAFFQNSGTQITISCGLPADYTEIITGIIILFIIGCEFFVNYSIKFHKKGAEK
ncbi:MAG: ABC transporter permease [Clostridia bacterium]|nr:ABC transporter permease [Clostridia bacterium]